MVNDQVQVLGPMMNRLKSTGVYFTSPAPATSLPMLPGKLIRSVDSSPSAPAMIGEFSGPAGENYVMVVNLSLERSSKFTIKPTGTAQAMECVSPVDGSVAPLEKDGSVWLAAGQGALIHLK